MRPITGFFAAYRHGQRPPAGAVPAHALGDAGDRGDLLHSARAIVELPGGQRNADGQSQRADHVEAGDPSDLAADLAARFSSRPAARSTPRPSGLLVGHGLGPSEMLGLSLSLSLAGLLVGFALSLGDGLQELAVIQLYPVLGARRASVDRAKYLAAIIASDVPGRGAGRQLSAAMSTGETE